MLPSQFSPILGNPGFPPADSGDDYRAWQTAGCKCIGDLFDLEGLKSFEQLKEDYGLPDGERFRYQLVQHWVSHPSIRGAGRPMMSPEKWLITRTSNKRVLSDLFKLLQKDGHTGKTKGQLRWGEGAGTGAHPGGMGCNLC